MSDKTQADLEVALKGFRPEVFNMKHKSIVQRIEKVHKLRARIKDHEKRRKQLTKVVERKTLDERDLERLEAALAWEINQEKDAGHAAISTESTPLSPQH